MEPESNEVEQTFSVDVCEERLREPMREVCESLSQELKEDVDVQNNTYNREHRSPYEAQKDEGSSKESHGEEHVVCIAVLGNWVEYGITEVEVAIGKEVDDLSLKLSSCLVFSSVLYEDVFYLFHSVQNKYYIINKLK